MKQIASAEIMNRLHGVLFEEVEIFVTTDVKTPDPTNCISTFEIMRLCIRNLKKREKE